MYKLTDNTKSKTEQTVIRLSDGASIPHTDKNYFPVYLDWLADGNTPGPADEPVVVESKFTGKRPSELTDSEKDEILFSGLLNKNGEIK